MSLLFDNLLLTFIYYFLGNGSPLPDFTHRGKEAKKAAAFARSTV